MPPLDEALKVPATKVEGCTCQVWLNFHEKDGIYFEGDVMLLCGGDHGAEIFV